ncbi:hypothetical protein BGX28_006222 [Mortierella sp. GBA30]|nr:hypothetical protein BGX28_006222 [Mortierella sp. GBA30]
MKTPGPHFRARNAVIHAALLGNLAGSALCTTKGPVTTFELQTNLVTCGTENASSTGIGSESSTTTAVAVCSPPESKLFGNVKVIRGTPQPGSTGVRGRLYDVGKLCDAKVTDKIDRAWVAFLDCDGCPLVTKLANLQSSNPQAILIYNQTTCVFPASPDITSPESTPVKPDVSPSVPPAVPTTVPTTAPPADSHPGGTSDSADDDGAQPHKDPDDAGNKEEPGHGDGEEGKDSLKHPSIMQARDDGPSVNDNKIASQLRAHPYHPILEKVSKKISRLFRRDQQAVSTVDPAESVIKFPTMIAMAEQVTVDYLFQALLGPASFAPLPTALKSLKTIAAMVPDSGSGIHNNSNTITDLMVSVSPTSGDPSSSEPKFLTMSKPIFAVIIGLLCAVVCGVILMYVVRPLILRRRRRQAVPNSSDSHSFAGIGGNHDSSDSGVQHTDANYMDAFHFNEPKDINSFEIQEDTGYGQRPLLIPDHGAEYEKYEAQDAGNRVPPTHSNLPSSDGLRDPTEPCHVLPETDDALYAQSQLKQLRQQDPVVGPHDHDDHPSQCPIHSGDEPIPTDELRSVLPSWRKTCPPPAPLQVTSLRMPHAWAKDHNTPFQASNCRLNEGDRDQNENENDGGLSATSSRCGSDLFHSPDKKLAPLPPTVETSPGTKSGALITAFYRQRVGIDSPAAPSVKNSFGDGARGGSAHSDTPRTSAPDMSPFRNSNDLHRHDIQQRLPQITPSSRKKVEDVGSGRASFSDDFVPESRRQSLELLRTRYASGSQSLQKGDEYASERKESVVE